jgi:hypothetical protein
VLGAQPDREIAVREQASLFDACVVETTDGPALAEPLPRRLGARSSNVTDSADADQTVQTAAATAIAIAIVSAPRMGTAGLACLPD